MGRSGTNTNSSSAGDDTLFRCDEQNCHRRPFKCSVDGCAASYTRKQHLVRHANVSHKKDHRTHRCQADDCIATFDTNESLRQHFRRAHFGTKLNNGTKPKCDQCGIQFCSISKLEQHTVSVHQVACGTCQMLFTNAKDLKEHEDRHRANKVVIECKYCDLKFEDAEACVLHRRTEQHLLKRLEELTCSKCGKSFKHKGNFNYHIKIHNEVRTVFRCSYEGCDRSYYFMKNLRHHTRTVHQLNLFPRPKCSICDKDFSSKQRHENHINVTHQQVRQGEKKTEARSRIGEPREEVIIRLSGTRGRCARTILKTKRQPGKLLSEKLKLEL